MNKFTIVISELIKFICISGLIFVWCNFYYRNAKYSLILSLIIASIILVVLWLFNSKRNKKKSLKSAEINKINSYSNTLLFSDNSFVFNFYKKLLKTKFPNVIKNKSSFSIKTEEKNIYFIPFYEKEELENIDIIKIIKNIDNKENKDYQIIIFCIKTNENCLKIKKKFDKNFILIFDEKDTYFKLFKKLDIYPVNENLNLTKKADKISKNELLYMAFNRNKTKSYLSSALFLLMFSFFTRYNIYFIITSSLLFIFALYSRFNSPFNKKDENILEK